MMTDATRLAVLALLLPAAAFLILALVRPLRRSGPLAGFLSLAFALTSLAAAVIACLTVDGGGPPAQATLTWLPQARGALASVGVLGDADSLQMLVLVALVASLVQAYSLAYLHDEPAPSLGR